MEGFAGPEFLSFESTTRPGYYCCVKEGKLRLEGLKPNDPEFARKCSFKLWKDKYVDQILIIDEMYVWLYLSFQILPRILFF